jgi:hypothetical protein
VKPQVSQHFGESCQVTESGMTEPGLQADSLPPCARVLRRCGAQTVLKKVEAEGLVAVRRGGARPRQTGHLVRVRVLIMW